MLSRSRLDEKYSSDMELYAAHMGIRVAYAGIPRSYGRILDAVAHAMHPNMHPTLSRLRATQPAKQPPESFNQREWP